MTPAPRAQPISVQFGHQAIDGLAAQIADAIRCGDYERTVALQHIRRDVELLLQATQVLRFELAGRRSPARAFQEHQAAFVIGNLALPTGAPRSVHAKPATGMEDLTPREREIIQHLAHGATNKAIARNLDIAEATVKVHIKTLLRKLHLKNRTQAALWAVQQGV